MYIRIYIETYILYMYTIHIYDTYVYIYIYIVFVYLYIYVYIYIYRQIGGSEHGRLCTHLYIHTCTHLWSSMRKGKRPRIHRYRDEINCSRCFASGSSWIWPVTPNDTTITRVNTTGSFPSYCFLGIFSPSHGYIFINMLPKSGLPQGAQSHRTKL